MAKIHVNTTINGAPTEFLCDANQTLLDVLRDNLGLTGSKEGCGSGDCAKPIAHHPSEIAAPRLGRNPALPIPDSLLPIPYSPLPKSRCRT